MLFGLYLLQVIEYRLLSFLSGYWETLEWATLLRIPVRKWSS